MDFKVRGEMGTGDDRLKAWAQARRISFGSHRSTTRRSQGRWTHVIEILEQVKLSLEELTSLLRHREPLDLERVRGDGKGGFLLERVQATYEFDGGEG